MNTKFMVTVLVFAVVCTVAAADKKGKGKEHKWMCKGTEIKFSDDSKKSMGECWKEMKERKEKDKKDNESDDKKHFKPDACFMACKMEKMKAVVDGKADVSAMNKFVEDALPEAVQKDAKSEIGKCFDAEKDTKFSKDDDCKSYTNLGKCQMKGMKKVCKNDNEDDV